MSKFAFLLCASLAFFRLDAEEVANKKVYECQYLEEAPHGVIAWAQFVKNRKGGDSRFVDYNSNAAKGLILDATAAREFEKEATSLDRATTFHMAYNDKGWYLYIEAKEPLLNDILDEMIDPSSKARNEAYEIFFAPGLQNAPYYQVFTRPFGGSTDIHDWGSPHRHYRSLKSYAKIESVPLENSFGTFMFIPWEALYERVPLNGEHWRFSIIRWMPFGKAGGVTWGGTVHETGNFGLVHFAKPTAEQRNKIQRNLARYAWFKFRAKADGAARFWNDEKIGDPEFFDRSLKPVIEKFTQIGESLGHPSQWDERKVTEAAANLEDWMEFDYLTSEIRKAYLEERHFSGDLNSGINQ